MANADSVKQKIQGLIDNANGVTGNADTNLTDAMEALAAGYGQGADPILTDITITENGEYTPDEGVDGFGKVTVEVESGGGFPELVYETTFEVDEAKTSGSGDLCAISTGFTPESQWASDGEVMAIVIELTNADAGYTPNDKDVVSSTQCVYVDGYDSWAANAASSVKFRNGKHTSNNAGVGIYVTARPNLFASVTIGYRLPTGEMVAPGIYTFKLYRTGVSHA